MNKYIRICDEIYKINKVVKNCLYLIQLTVDNDKIYNNELHYRHYIDNNENIVSMYIIYRKNLTDFEYINNIVNVYLINNKLLKEYSETSFYDNVRLKEKNVDKNYIRICKDIYKINKVTTNYIYLIQLIVDREQNLNDKLFYKHYIDTHSNIVTICNILKSKLVDFEYIHDIEDVYLVNNSLFNNYSKSLFCLNLESNQVGFDQYEALQRYELQEQLIFSKILNY